MRAVLISIAAAGCGSDIGLPSIDAAGVGGPPGSPSVVVMGPRHDESFYPSQSATVTWVATDDDTPTFSCDVSALTDTSSLPIAAAVATTSSATTSTPWMLATVAPGTYRVRVACTDANGLTGANLSATFQVSAAPQAVDYATQIQPIWTASCTTNACHDANQPAEGLNLTPSASRAELAATSGQCGAYKLVEPGMPERSYLVMKLQGSGPCLIGTKMPKANQSLSAAQIQLVRDWIFNGAR